MAGESSREPVGKTGQHVLFMDHDGQAKPPGGEVGRGGDVSAEAEHHISLGAAQQSNGPLDRLDQARSHECQILSDSSWHRYRRDQLEFQPGRWHDCRLQASSGADCRECQVRGKPA